MCAVGHYRSPLFCLLNRQVSSSSFFSLSDAAKMFMNRDQEEKEEEALQGITKKAQFCLRSFLLFKH